MQRRERRTVIDLSRQPGLDFEDDSFRAAFTLPNYQRELLFPRTFALLTDLGIVWILFIIFFVLATVSEMPPSIPAGRRMLGIYCVAYLLFVASYFFLCMLGMSQTTGMRIHGLIASDKRGERLGPTEALKRSFGYLISLVPPLLGFLWAFVDPEHLTWADKISGTYIRRV